MSVNGCVNGCVNGGAGVGVGARVIAAGNSLMGQGRALHATHRPHTRGRGSHAGHVRRMYRTMYVNRVPGRSRG